MILAAKIVSMQVSHLIVEMEKTVVIGQIYLIINIVRAIIAQTKF